MTPRTVPALALLAATALALPLGGSSVGALGPHGFGPVVLTNAVDFGGEPGVDVGPDGTIYVNGPSGVGNFGSFGYWSTDGGATWSRCAFTTGPGGGDSNVAINPQGTIMMNDLWVGSLTVYVSTNKCASWTTVPVTTTVPVGDRQWIEHGHAPCEFFQTWNNLAFGVRAMRTTDCGLTWKESPAGFATKIGNLVADHSGATQNVYQLMVVNGAVEVAIGKVTNTIQGPLLTFIPRTIAPAASGHNVNPSFVAGAVDAAGTLHVVWHVIQAGSPVDSHIRYASSSNGGLTWTTPKVVSSGGSNVFPWIDAGAAGKANVVWYHSATPGNPNANAGPWFVQMAQTLDGGATWTESRATPVSIHNDNICTNGVGCPGDDRDLLDFFEVAHDAQGRALISFTRDADANGNGNGPPRNAFVRQISGPGIL